MKVAIHTSDLVFRSRLEAVTRASGASIVKGTDAADVVVVELTRDSDLDTCAKLQQTGARVLAFGPHVHANRLREARELGIEAVPNSQLDARLRDMIASR